MTDWLALAHAMYPDLPEEQARRIAPILGALADRFRPLANALPYEAEPATTFQPEVPSL